jgi:hypothetical protein
MFRRSSGALIGYPIDIDMISADEKHSFLQRQQWRL